MNDIEISASLRQGGLRYLGMVEDSEPLIPPRVAGFINSCPIEEGISGDALRLDDPELLERANSMWYRLALDAGLVDGIGGQFLVAVKRADEADTPRSWWARVELLEDWDIIGKGADSKALGHTSGRPAFVMLSRDGNIIVRGDYGEEYLDFRIARQPDRMPTLRRQAESLKNSRWLDDSTRDAIDRWLGESTATGA